MSAAPREEHIDEDDNTTTTITQGPSRRSISTSFRNILRLPDAVPSASAPRRPPLAPPPSSSRRDSLHGSRRSIAHRPDLIGLPGVGHVGRLDEEENGDDGDAAADVSWQDVSLEFDVERDAIPMARFHDGAEDDDDDTDDRIRVKSYAVNDVERYGKREGDESDDDDDDRGGGGGGNKVRDISAPTPLGTPTPTPATTASLLHTQDRPPPSPRSHPALSPPPPQRSHAPTLKDFEPLTRNEKASYWTTMVLVLLLSAVAVGIGYDWIDWPGDGIGKN